MAQQPVKKTPIRKAKCFQWTSDHDGLLCREVIASEPYNFKLRSPERGQLSETIAAGLDSLQQPKFKVTARAVRDRYALLTSKQKQKLREEEKASGIKVPDQIELDALLEEILEREKIAKEKSDAQTDEKKAKADNDKCAAEEVRQNALKSMAAKRKIDDSGEKPKVGKLRRSTASAIEYLREKSEKERELKKEELAIRKREIEVTAPRQDDAIRQQQAMFTGLMNQMQQQQQLQQQNLQAVLAQQSKLFMALLENRKNE